MAIELVVFDMAGTTVYDSDAVNNTLKIALEAVGVEVNRDAVNKVMGIAKPLAIRTLLMEKGLEHLPPTDENVTRIHAIFETKMLEYYKTSAEIREVPGASETFAVLKAANIKIGLDTGFSRVIADAILERLGWQSQYLIDATVTVDEVEKGRPYPDMIFRLMELTGVTEVANVVKVGDTPSDLQQGTTAGCTMTIGVTQGSHTREELEPYPHTHLIPTVADLPALLGL